MDIIALSDIYSDINTIQEFIQIASQSIDNKPTIIITGDIGIRTALTHYKQDINTIINSLSKISKQILYIPGDSDTKEIEITTPNAKNLDRQNHIIEDGDVKIGLLGLGGAPTHSMRSADLSPYLWDESIPMVAEDLLTELKINIEKIAQAQPDHIILITHSPPYGIADRSKPITLHEMLVLEDILEELKGETKTETEETTKKTPTSIRHLGSRTISNFVKYYKPDIHIFGHVHKEGGKTETQEATKFFNVSHLSPLPYKLTGRKYLHLKITKQKITATFDHAITERNIPFSEFVERYL
jgi:Icc-related predicted phosphoesterase